MRVYIYAHINPRTIVVILRTFSLVQNKNDAYFHSAGILGQMIRLLELQTYHVAVSFCENVCT